MDKTVVIYQSEYGYTKRYAEWLSEELSCPLFEKRNFHPRDFNRYDIIIYGGGLYAGGVNGVKLLTQHKKLLAGKKIVLFTCGLAEPADSENISHIRQTLSDTLSAEWMNSMEIFHLRGGIDYTNLRLLHKSMMAMLRRMLLKKESTALTAEDRQLLETYGKKLDFTDRAALKPIIAYIQETGSVT